MWARLVPSCKTVAGLLHWNVSPCDDDEAVSGVLHDFHVESDRTGCFGWSSKTPVFCFHASKSLVAIVVPWRTGEVAAERPAALEATSLWRSWVGGSFTSKILSTKNSTRYALFFWNVGDSFIFSLNYSCRSWWTAVKPQKTAGYCISSTLHGVFWFQLRKFGSILISLFNKSTIVGSKSAFLPKEYIYDTSQWIVQMSSSWTPPPVYELIFGYIE